MNQNNFDEQVRKAVENISSDYQPNSWDLLEQRLNNAAPPQDETLDNSIEDEFDNIIRQKIGAKTTAYNPSHWLIMSTVLDEYFSIPAWLRRHKVLEIGLIVLFLFTFVNVFYIPNRLNTSIFTEETTSKTNDNTKNQFISKQSNSYLATAEKNTEIRNNDLFFTNSKNIFVEKNNTNLLPLKEESNPNTSQSEHEIIASSDVKNIPILNERAKSSELSKLPVLALKNIEKGENPLIFTQKTVKKIKKWQPYLGLLAMANINHVKTPESYFFGTHIPEFLQYKFGQGMGLTLGLKKSRWAIETGFFIDKKVYEPAVVRLEVGGSISANAHTEDLEDIKMNNIQIPIQFNFDFLKNKRLSVFALAGVTTNIIMQAKYDKSRSFIGYAMRPIPTIEPTPEIVKGKYDDGFLVSPTFKTNTFGSLSSGLGASYKITPYWSMLGQAKYDYYMNLEGIGPNNDRINTYSFWLGLRKAF